MNYLAHILLSGEDLKVAVGNFIGDGVKGRIEDRFPREIEIGLRLHRFIDELADTHPLNRVGREKLYGEFGKYAGVAQDMYHDHFLALYWDRFQSKSIGPYLEDFYETADQYLDIFPEHQLRFLNGIRHGGWLMNYSEIDGMERAFKGLARRIGRPSRLEQAGEYLKKEHHELEKDFFRFYPLLSERTAEELVRLLTKL